MEVTKDSVLESINTYCTERKYGSETLSDDFKEKFINSFVKKYDQKDVEESDMLADLKFNLDTAFNASLVLKNSQMADFTKKEDEYKSQIEELNKKLGKKPREQQQVEIPKEIKDQLDELKKFKDEEAKKSKFKNVMEIAKKLTREDLHKSLASYAKDFAINMDESDEEQAKRLTSRFQEIFKDSIGDIKPLAPKVTLKQEEEFIESLPKVKI